MSFTTTQVLGVGSVCFIALTYRNLDLKYTMNVSERTQPHHFPFSLSLSAVPDRPPPPRPTPRAGEDRRAGAEPGEAEEGEQAV